MKKIPIRLAHKVKYVFLKNWDAIFIIGVAILLGAALWKVFPVIEEKVLYNKKSPDSVEHSEIGMAEVTTKSSGFELFMDKTRDFLGIPRVDRGVSPDATLESQKEQDMITRDKVERLDETLRDIKDRLREDKELREIP